MRVGESGNINAAINVTPLVDVVLVLLIIFMVMAPEMRKGPDINVPNTAKPEPLTTYQRLRFRPLLCS
jgi:biopolymer transport protein ExbD